MLRILTTLFLIAFAVLSVQSLGFMQSAAVRGQITCNGKPEAGLKLKLYDHDTFTPSDRMGQTVTGNDGSFYMAGHKAEITSVVPELRIYHKCGHFFFRHCSKIRIPPNYVSSGPTPQSTYDAGIIKLETMTNNC